MYILTNVDIDERLVDTALRLTGEKTKRAVIHRALEELVRLERLRALRGARGTLKWEGSLADMREEGTRGTAASFRPITPRTSAPPRCTASRARRATPSRPSMR